MSAPYSAVAHALNATDITLGRPAPGFGWPARGAAARGGLADIAGDWRTCHGHDSTALLPVPYPGPSKSLGGPVGE